MIIAGSSENDQPLQDDLPSSDTLTNNLNADNGLINATNSTDFLTPIHNGLGIGWAKKDLSAMRWAVQRAVGIVRRTVGTVRWVVGTIFRRSEPFSGR